MGQSPPSSTYNEHGEGLPFYQGKADFRLIHPIPRKWCSQPLKIAIENDVLISVRAPVGPANICPEKSCIGRGLAAIRAKNEVDCRFIFFCLRSKERELAELGKGSTFGAIKRDELRELAVPLPPLPEQRRIVARIEELVSRIEEAKRLRRAAREETEAIMPAALHDVFSQAEAKGWRKVRLVEIVEEIRSGFACGKQHAVTEGIPHLRTNNIGIDGELDLSHLIYMPDYMVDLATYSLKKEDVLFNNTNSAELVGKTAIIREDLPFAFSNHLTRIRTKRKLIEPKWLVLNLRCLWYQRFFEKRCRRWIGQAGFSPTRLKEVEIFIPPLSEQRRIVTHLDRLQTKVEELRRLEEETEREIEAMTSAILDKAFQGGL